MIVELRCPAERSPSPLFLAARPALAGRATPPLHNQFALDRESRWTGVDCTDCRAIRRYQRRRQPSVQAQQYFLWHTPRAHAAHAGRLLRKFPPAWAATATTRQALSGLASTLSGPRGAIRTRGTQTRHVLLPPQNRLDVAVTNVHWRNRSNQSFENHVPVNDRQPI